MTQEQLVKLLTEIRRRTGRRARRAVLDILSTAFPFSGHKGRFTFSVSRNLDAAVNALLLALSDGILDDIDGIWMREADEEDRDAVYAWSRREIKGEGVTERLDAHSSHLKYILEGFLAVSFARGITLAEMEADVWTYLEAPYAYPPMREAFTKRDLFNARIIRGRGFHFGRGEQTDALLGLDLVASFTLDAALQYIDILRYRKRGATAYMCHRGSDYDCDLCDSLCAVPHPIDEVVLPAHPRCMCWTTPIYGAKG